MRQRRNKASTRTVLENQEEPRDKAPNLPELAPRRSKKNGREVVERQEWHPMARRFWELVWSSPQHNEFIRADEPALFRLVYLVHLFWTRGSLALAAEIRMLEREFGLTPLSRRRLEWTVVQAEEAKDKREANRARRAVPIDAVAMDPRGVLDL